MAFNIDNITQEQLEDLVSQLEIKTDNIYHLLLTNGMEMVGEIYPPDQLWQRLNMEEGDECFEELLAEQDELDLELVDEDGDEIEFETDEDFDDLLFLNPIKIYRDSWIEESGEFRHTNYFLEWNPCIDGPYTHIAKSTVVSMNKPNAETMVRYLKAIYQIYYPLLDEIPDGNLQVFSDKVKLTPTSGSKSANKKKEINVIDFRMYHSKRLNGVF